jgi:hypothetical protein
MDNSKPYLDQENLDDIIVYSHSLEVWNPEYSVPGVAGKEAGTQTKVLFLGHWISKAVIQMDQEVCFGLGSAEEGESRQQW